MTIAELYEKSKSFGLEDDEVDEVLAFLRFYEGQLGSRRVGVCGLCKERKTDQCPFPEDCLLTQPACLTFKYKF